MAKVLFTAVVADMRGKLAGTVFSKNKSGAYTRTKVSPTNPRSADQTIVRQRLGAFAASWRGLSQVQRDSWSSASASFPRRDVYGNTYFLTGQQLYIALNTNLLTIGESELPVAPTPVAVPEFTVTGLYADSSANTLNATIAEAVPAGYQLVVQATEPSSPGKANLSNKFRQIAVFPSGTVTSLALSTGYLAKFGSLPVGQRVSIKAYLIAEASGQAGVPQTLTTIIAE